MKLIASGPLRFGMRRFVEGEVFELPEKFARSLVASGKATAASESAEGSAEPESEPEPRAKRAYRTRRMKAEDSD